MLESDAWNVFVIVHWTAIFSLQTYCSEVMEKANNPSFVPFPPLPLRWLHNECDGVSNHQPHDCLLKRLFRRRSKKTSKLRVTGLCAGNSPVTGEFPAQRTITRKMFPFDDVIMPGQKRTSMLVPIFAKKGYFGGGANSQDQEKGVIFRHKVWKRVKILHVSHVCLFHPGFHVCIVIYKCIWTISIH